MQYSGPRSVASKGNVQKHLDVVQDLLNLALEAQCILGNHELNILRGEHKHGNHWFFGEPEIIRKDAARVCWSNKLKRQSSKDKEAKSFQVLADEEMRAEARRRDSLWQLGFGSHIYKAGQGLSISCFRASRCLGVIFCVPY